jgi:5'-deoxynucleotidase YfbR-like HD superfamily hydrolase
MLEIQNTYQFILELDKLKQVFRNTITDFARKESTAEHSWSVAMIVLVLLSELKKEFPQFDELKTLKLALIHDIVEIYAGDIIAFDLTARKEKEQIEIAALHQLMAIYPEFGRQLHDLWLEFEKRESLEAQIAKAADSICPIFQRLHSKQSYVSFNVTLSHLEKTKSHYFTFSQVFSALYQKLKSDLLIEQLIENV